MRSRTRLPSRQTFIHRQCGVVLFFALIAMVAMSLAAVALIRSVDTSTMIAGNLAFKQSATSAGDAGVEAAIAWLDGVSKNNVGLNAVSDINHPFNMTAAASGYYSNFNPDLNLTDGTGIQWDNNDSMALNPDSNGNTTRYIIQRMCRNANVALKDANCLFSAPPNEGEEENIKLPQDWCDISSPGCPVPGQTPQIRITARTVGPRNTISYIQAFVY